MIRTTRKQREALLVKWTALTLDEHAKPAPSYRDFRRTVQGTIGCDGAVVVHWRGMWLAIETDGHCHT